MRLVGHRLPQERHLFVGFGAAEVDVPDGAGPWQLLEHEGPRQRERVGRDSHAEHGGQAATTEIDGIGESHRCTGTPGEQLFGCLNNL